MGRKKKKKGAAPPAMGGLPPPPGAIAAIPPPPGAIAAIPPPPGAAAAIPPPPPPSGDVIPVPPPPVSPAKPAKGVLEGSSAPTISGLAPPDMAKEKKKDGYDSLWKRGSSKPLQQVYGHIDRLGEGEVGSLLDRYADRFGHQLDREIIVKRKAEHDSKIAEIRDAPTIELLDEEELEEIEEESHEEEEDIEEMSEDDDSEHVLDSQTLEDLSARKSELEANIQKLKPKYQLAKQKSQTSKLRKLKPKLEQLISEHKSIKAVIQGEQPLSSLEIEDEEEIEVQAEDSDIFAEFVSIVDNLLAKLPDPDSFIRSDSFELYAAVASDPGNAGENERIEFFGMVDSLLLDLPEDDIQEFTQSTEFAIYSEAGSQYGS